MKTLKNYILLVVFLGGALTSCNFLDKEPTKIPQQEYFNTADEASSFLTGIYAILGQQSFYGGDYLYLVGGDDLSHYGGVNRAPASSGLICKNATASDAAVAALWYTLYSGINRANIFLENIGKVQNISDDLRRQYESEARFLRAFYYFTLVQAWGDVPFRTASTSDVVGLNAPRTNKQDIYKFIIDEMETAASDETGGLLTAEALNFRPGRISKSTAWGMLARIYLFRAGEYHREKRAQNQDEATTYYQQAKYYAELVTTQKHELTKDYWDLFIDLCSDEYNTTRSNESIWEIEFAGNNTSDIKAEGRIGNIIGISAPDLSSKGNIVGASDPGYAYEFIFATPKLYKLYGTPIDAAGALTDPKSDAAKQLKNSDTRFFWNIAPFKYVEAGGKNTGVTGREFYEEGALDRVLELDNNRSYSYGNLGGNKDNCLGDYTNVPSKDEYARACAKYRREYEADKKDKNSTAINFPVLRYSDVLLMIAEAENELNGPTPRAKECLYEVRKRAGLTDPLPAMDKDVFRQAVKDERGRELCFEYTRHFDLIRWGELVKNMTALVEEATNGQAAGWKQGPSNVYTYFMMDDSYNYFPIPEAEMAINKAITENNPGW